MTCKIQYINNHFNLMYGENYGSENESFAILGFGAKRPIGKKEFKLYQVRDEDLLVHLILSFYINDDWYEYFM